MIERYTRKEMGDLWTAEHRFEKMLEVEIAVAKAQAKFKMIPTKAARSIEKSARFSTRRILEIEKTTKHDVIAFVSNVAESVGPMGRFVHYGLTSSDVLDTAFSLQVQEAGALLLKSISEFLKTLKKKAKEHGQTLCPGRTHGMFAEPTSFGVKLAGIYLEIQRSEIHLREALEQMAICKLSGAVGTYSSMGPRLGPQIESYVAKQLNLRCEKIATQVVPRDRHAQVLSMIAMVGVGLERLAIELRHLQRSEVAEVTEGFSKGQKGSSAMPHKKNPITAENITGLVRLLKSYAQAGMDNVALWHERDISHSSVERVIFPDAFIVLHYALFRAQELIANLQVHKKRMLENIEMSQGQLFSSQVLLLLVRKGLSREEAYSHVQRLSHSLGKGDHLREFVLRDSELKKYLRRSEVLEIFNGKILRQNFKLLMERI